MALNPILNNILQKTPKKNYIPQFRVTKICLFKSEKFQEMENIHIIIEIYGIFIIVKMRKYVIVQHLIKARDM